MVTDDGCGFPAEGRRLFSEGYLFLDWFAIPQITARAEGVNEDMVKTEAAKAVQSIPAYAARRTWPREAYLKGIAMISY